MTAENHEAFFTLLELKDAILTGKQVLHVGPECDIVISYSQQSGLFLADYGGNIQARERLEEHCEELGFMAELPWWSIKGQPVVYLIHFEIAYKHAQHYLGTAFDLKRRLEQHRRGCLHGGARLMEVVTRAGIPWRVTRVWPGGRELEAQLKHWKNGRRLCPTCKAEAIAARMFASSQAGQREMDVNMFMPSR